MAGPKAPLEGKQEDSQGEEGFLGRWSRRKAEANIADQTEASSAADLAEGQAGETAAVTDQPDEPPAFDVSTLPDIDSLGPGSDFSMFMQAGVPPALKTKALRKLWRVKPELANLDGLLDYGEDLTGSFKVVDHLKTAYEVGRGFLQDEKPEDDGKAADDDDRAIADEQKTPEVPALSDASASTEDESGVNEAEPGSDDATSDDAQAKV